MRSMKKRRKITAFLLYLTGFFLLLLGTLFLDSLSNNRPDRFLTPEVPASAIDDAKISFTLQTYRNLSKQYKHPSRLEPVNAPGLVIRIYMPDQLKEDYRVARGSRLSNHLKFAWMDVGVSLADRPMFRSLIRIRGGNSTLHDKKSFIIDFLESQQFTPDIRLRKIMLLNLYADIHGFEMSFSYRVLQQLGLFPSFTQMVVVYVNDEPQGYYLLVERPKDAVRRTVENVISLYRQRKKDRYILSYASPDFDHQKTISLLKQAHDVADDQSQVQQYEKLVDLENYMTLLGFNSLVQNIDAELFFYETRKVGEKQGKLRAIGWDFDDLQEDVYVKRKPIDDPLVWACVHTLEQNILQNSLLGYLLDSTTPHMLWFRIHAVSGLRVTRRPWGTG